ncbi:YeiH family protein [Bacillus sp. FJAT-29790]|uniref:YeiH family protein n=1 Tax=Bacillus sp. FJAT-29790 TaxID=1895002 RepID=UPI00349F07BF
MEAQKIQQYALDKQPKKKLNYKGYAIGIGLTLLLALIAGQMTKLPFLSIMGIMILSILLGGAWGNTLSVPAVADVGVKFSSKILLRAGIILLGFRLNLKDILDAGFSILIIDVIVIAFTMGFILLLGKLFSIDKGIAALIAAGTAICGAAAIVAVAPIVKSKQEHTAIAVSCIAVLGTIGAILYIFLFPYLPLSEQEYGVMVGATLHELAHVIAGADAGGAISSDSAILVKLGRVLLLIPVALLISYFMNRKNQQNSSSLKNLPIPWFIFGFLLMSLVNTLNWIPNGMTNFLLLVSTYLLAMGMVGLGLNIKWKDFVKVGFKPIGVGIVGFLGLLALTPLLLFIYRFFI